MSNKLNKYNCKNTRPYAPIPLNGGHNAYKINEKTSNYKIGWIPVYRPLHYMLINLKIKRDLQKRNLYLILFAFLHYIYIYNGGRIRKISGT